MMEEEREREEETEAEEEEDGKERVRMRWAEERRGGQRIPIQALLHHLFPMPNAPYQFTRDTHPQETLLKGGRLRACASRDHERGPWRVLLRGVRPLGSGERPSLCSDSRQVTRGLLLDLVQRLEVSHHAEI